MNERKLDEKTMEKKQQDTAIESIDELDTSEICVTNEIEIEEIAIDGICGVY